MTVSAVRALERLGAYVLDLPSRLHEVDWEKPTGCPGWSVHDVLIHLTNTLREVVDPNSLPAGVPGDIEATNNRHVEHFRGCTPGQTLEVYRRLLPLALVELEGMQSVHSSDVLVDFDNAGKFPAHLVADSLVFDHYCHIRHDLSEPRGLLENVSLPATREFLEPSIAWLMAGLPQMSPPELSGALTAPVRLFLSGNGGSSWVLSRSADGSIRNERGEDGKVAATIITDADAFILWATKRTTGSDAVPLFAIRGDRQLGRTVQQNIHVY